MLNVISLCAHGPSGHSTKRPPSPYRTDAPPDSSGSSLKTRYKRIIKFKVGAHTHILRRVHHIRVEYIVEEDLSLYANLCEKNYP